MIGYREFERYLAFVRRSDVHAVLEAALAGAPQGRKRALTCDVLLAGMVATATRDKNLTLVAVHRTLVDELATDYQRILGIRGARGPLTVRQVRYLWNCITDLYEHTEARRPDLTLGERVERSGKLQHLIDQLLASATLHIGAAGRYAVDESAIDSPARGKGRPRRGSNAPGPEDQDADEPEDRYGRSADVDARWGYRTKTYHNRTNQVFGYQMVGFTGVAPVGGVPRPLLMERISVVAANCDGIDETISGLQRMREDGVPVVEVLADRGFSYKLPERWADKLRAMGIDQVLDLHPNDNGARAHKDGYVMVDGWAHCPSIPDHLIRIAKPTRLSVADDKKNATREERLDAARRRAEVDEFNRLIAERRVYRFERAGRTAGGNERFTCPSRAGKLKCGGCPLSADYDDVPEVTPPVNEAGELSKACAQTTITLKPSVEPKLRQREYWGSPEWQLSYNRRSDVERSFGLLKTADGGGVQRGWTRQHGLVKTTLLLAIAVAASNLRILLSWARRTRDTRDPLTTMDVASRGFVELDDAGQPPTATGPPRGPTA